MAYTNIYYKNSFLYKTEAKKYVITPHSIFEIIPMFMHNATGLYKKEEKRPNQNELHSGHSKGTCM